MTDRSKEDHTKNKQNNVNASSNNAKNNNVNSEKKLDGLQFETKDRALVMKSMNLGPNDAYNISKKIKVTFHSNIYLITIRYANVFLFSFSRKNSTACKS